MNENLLLQSSDKNTTQRYVELRLPDGKLACRFDPVRGLLEVQARGIKHYFDLTQVALSIDNNIHAR